MKKTFIAILALAGAASAEISVKGDDITVSGESSLTINDDFLKEKLKNPENWTDIDTKCKVGSFFFSGYTSADSVSLTISTTIGLYQLEIADSKAGGVGPGTIALNFENGATIYTSNVDSYASASGEQHHISYGTSQPDVTINVSLSGSQVTALIDTKALVYELTHTGSSWNYERMSSLTLNNVAELDAMKFTNRGVITSAEELHELEYGLINTKQGLKLVANAPEPATATLSLLALAGLVARRKRH